MAADILFYIKALNKDITVSLETHYSDEGWVDEKGNPDTSDKEEVPPAYLEYITEDLKTHSFPMDGTKVTVKKGTMIYFSTGSNENVGGLSTGEGAYRSFSIGAVGEDEDASLKMTARCELGGNVMSLVCRDYRTKKSVDSQYCFYGLFSGCDAVTTAPDLPATSLSAYCYSRMFEGCQNLESAPSLSHVTSVAEGCCSYMFDGCSSMNGTASVPLASEGLADSCYKYMFGNCKISSFDWTVPETFVMKASCFESMFSGCWMLNKLPDGFGFGGVTELAEECFAWMFSGTGISSIPKMPPYTTALASSCYEGMFKSCTSLTNATGFVLPETAAYACCRDMFMGCAALSGGVSASFDLVKQLDGECFSGMFSGCASLTRGPIPYGVEMSESCYESMFENSGVTKIGYDNISSDIVPSKMAPYCFDRMFYGCESLSSISNIDLSRVDELADGCFRDMFGGCTSLSEMPSMPSGGVSMKKSCCEGMYAGCTGIRSSTFKIIGEMAERCCFEMFSGCTSLGDVYKMFLSDGMYHSISCAPECFCRMFNGCSGMTSTPAISLAAYADKCCSEMFAGCSGATTAGTIMAEDPEIIYPESSGDYEWSERWDGDDDSPGEGDVDEKKVGRFFYKMFSGCTSLSRVAGIPSAGLDAGYEAMSYMFTGCTSLKGLDAIALSAQSVGDGCYSYMFAGCTGMTYSPKIGAMSSGNSSFRCMFSGCTSLVDIGKIEALTNKGTIGYGGCYGMFYKCKSLTSAPDIDVGSVGDYGLAYMFGECTGLTVAGQISFSSIGKYAFAYMYYGCSGIEDAGSVGGLSGGSLGTADEHSFDSMFKKCTGLVTVGSIGAREMKASCCSEMFSECTGIESVGLISADVMGDSCLNGMFRGCNKLVRAGGVNANSMGSNCCENMFAYTSSSQEQGYSDGLHHELVVAGITAGSIGESCFMNMFRYNKLLSVVPDINIGEDYSAPLSKECFRGMFSYCTSIVYVDRQAEESQSGGSGQDSVPDDVIPALGFTSLAEGCYKDMFEHCTSLVEIPVLPATTLHPSCYSGMFRGCTGIVEIGKKLSDENGHRVSTAASCCKEMFAECTGIESVVNGFILGMDYSPNCFEGMFSGCTGLTKNVQTPKAHNAVECCKNMFSGCKNIRTIVLMANKTAESCYYGMFQGCCAYGSDSGLDSGPGQAAEVDIKIGLDYDGYAKSCFAHMFEGCKMIKSQVDIFRANSVTLSESCFASMFQNSGVSNVDLRFLHMATKCYEAMFAGCPIETVTRIGPGLVESGNFGTLADYCYKDMFSGSSIDNMPISLGTMPTDEESATAVGCFDGMFSGCLELVDATVKKSKKVKDNAIVIEYEKSLESLESRVSKERYARMFSGCTNLKTVPSLPAESLEESCYESMFEGCTSLETPPELKATTLAGSCYKKMFFGCTGLMSLPDLDAEVLMPNCYESMFGMLSYTEFNDDDMISSEKGIGAHTFADRCCLSMFANNGKIKSFGYVGKEKNGESSVVAVRMVGSMCCSSMFNACRAISVPPSLPATTMSTNCYDNMFSGCTGLSYAPELPASVLAEYCYSSMFSGCSFEHTYYVSADGSKHGLVSIDAKMAQSCCSNMFSKCYELVDPPSLPSKDLASSCYSSMFTSCSSLVSIPELPATNLATNCYNRMFSACGVKRVYDLFTDSVSIGYGSCNSMFCYCRYLISVGNIGSNGASVGDSGFSSMFSGCTALQSVDSISANDMGEYCCKSMFKGLAGLTSCPMIEVGSVGVGCFEEMFSGCTSISEAKLPLHHPKGGVAGPLLDISPRCYMSMFYDCKGLTSIPELPATDLSGAESCYKSMFGMSEYDDSIDPETRTLSVKITATSFGASCCDGMFKNNSRIASADKIATSSDVGDYCFKEMFYGCSSLSSFGGISVAEGEGRMGSWCCSRMFYGCDSLFNEKHESSGSGSGGQNNTGYCMEISVSEVAYGGFNEMFRSSGVAYPAKIVASSLGNRCCDGMFSECGALEAIPSDMFSSIGKIDAGCFHEMFKSCVNLKSVTSLDFEVKDSCYESMFSGCTSLESVPVDMLKQEPIADRCYYGMFSGCTGLKTLPSLPATDISYAYACYAYMFSGCTGVSEIAEGYLPASSISAHCYEGMFSGCTGLKDVSGMTLVPDELMPSCYRSMFEGCSFTDASNMFPTGSSGDCSIRSVEKGCMAAMFRGCTALKSAPKMPISSVPLYNVCYSRMFEGCSSLSSAPEIGAVDLADGCYQYMFKSCAALKDVHPLPAVELKPRCYRYMFDGCRSLEIIPSIGASSFPSECCAGMFRGTGVKDASGAIGSGVSSVGTRCFAEMFSGCASLDKMPLIRSSSSLFNGSDSKTAIDLSGIDVSYGFAESMFSGAGNADVVRSLKIACKSADEKSFYRSFYGSKLVSSVTIDISDGTAGDECFSHAFDRCSMISSFDICSMKSAGAKCFEYMFSSCSSLGSIGSEDNPFIISVESAGDGCFSHMFSGSSVEKAYISLERYLGPNGCYYMFKSCDSLSSLNMTIGEAEEERRNVDDSELNTFIDSCESLRALSVRFMNVDKFSGYALYDDPGGLDDVSIDVDASYVSNMVGQIVDGSNPRKIAIRIRADEIAEECFDSAFSKMSYVMSVDLDIEAKKANYRSFAYMFNGCFGGVPNSATVDGENSSDGIDPQLKVRISVDSAGDECFRGMFDGCALMTINEGSSISIGELGCGCCAAMFQECKGVDDTPSISFGTMSNTAYKIGCCESMFEGCTSLSISPSLNATTLAESCYKNMFKGCTALQVANDIGSRVMMPNCFESMFEGCTSLFVAPQLPATTLAASCYKRMFYGCTTLTYVRDLPAKELVSGCYRYMFGEARSIIGRYTKGYIDAPIRIYANSVAEHGDAWESPMGGMFSGCDVIRSISLAFTNDPDDASDYSGWLSADPKYANATIYIPKGSEVKNMIPDGWATEEYEGEMP